jgi:hypothetical protein
MHAMTDEREPSYERLAADLDAAIRQGNSWLRGAAIARLRWFLWKARSALDTMNAASVSPDDLSRAVQVWALLFRLQQTSCDEGVRRLNRLASEIGISPLSFYLREFDRDVGRAIFASSDPVKRLDRILHGRPPMAGRRGRDYKNRIKIAASVEKLLREGMGVTKAYKTVASTPGKHAGFSADAVQKIYKSVMRKRPDQEKDSADASLVRLIASDIVEF